MTVISAGELLNLLERDLIRKKEQPSGIFMREVGSPDGKRRADALYIQAVGGKGIDGYEIKVSRSDLAAELTDPTKVDSWKKYCRRWWLALPDEKLLAGLDIPDDWGIKVAPTAKNRVMFTVVRPAPLLEPEPIGPALGRIATVWAYRMRDQHMAVSTAEHRQAFAERAKREMEDKLRAHGLVPQAEPENHKAAMRLMQKLRERGIWSSLPGRHDDDEAKLDALIEGLADVLAGNSVRDKMANAAKNKLIRVNQALDTLDKSWEMQALRRELEGGLVF